VYLLQFYSVIIRYHAADLGVINLQVGSSAWDLVTGGYTSYGWVSNLAS